MPKIQVSATNVDIELTLAEHIWAMGKNQHIPATSIRGAEVGEKRWWMTLGLRGPGTAIPGLVIAGTYRRRGDKAFGYWSHKNPVLILNLVNYPYDRVFIGTPDAKALAEDINSALAAC